MQQHPQIAEAWLKAELEAQRYVLDPKNRQRVAEFVRQQTVGITTRMAWFSLYGAIPSERDGSPVRDEKHFVFDTTVRTFFDRTYANLYKSGLIKVDKAPEGAIDDSLARKVATEAGVPLPLGIIRAQPLSQAPQ
jgi:NitT/TauT family transport system substrate-binding protein